MNFVLLDRKNPHDIFRASWMIHARRTYLVRHSIMVNFGAYISIRKPFSGRSIVTHAVNHPIL